MKKTRIIATLMCVLAIGLCFTACGKEGDKENPVGSKTFTFEAEDTDLYGLSGPVFSGEASDYKMIMGANTKYIKESSAVLKSISNGYFVSYFNGPGTVLTFNFNSSKASEGDKLVLRFASEWGTLKINPTNIAVRVNGKALEYKEFTVNGQKLSNDGSVSAYKTPFKDFTLSEKINLVEGANTVEIEILNTNYGLNGFVKYGPGADCIKITTPAELTWEKLFEQRKTEITVEQ